MNDSLEGTSNLHVYGRKAGNGGHAAEFKSTGGQSPMPRNEDTGKEGMVPKLDLKELRIMMIDCSSHATWSLVWRKVEKCSVNKNLVWYQHRDSSDPKQGQQQSHGSVVLDSRDALNLG